MKGFLVFREYLKAIYAEHSALIIHIIRFIVTASAVFFVNNSVGYRESISGISVPLAMGIVGACLPYGVTAFLVYMLILVQISAVSLEATAVTGGFMLVVFLLYFAFLPGDSVLLLITPVCFFLKVPFVVPVLVGLAGGAMAVIPMGAGIFVYYVLNFIHQNSSFITGSEQSDITSVVVQVVKNLFGNQIMIIMIISSCLAVLVVRMVKNIAINYAWSFAIASGLFTQFVIIFLGDVKFGVSFSVVSIIAQMIASLILAEIYQLFVFTVDYSRAEYLRYEDDDYFYYVKAVPKVAVSKPDKKVQKINRIR